MAFDEGLTISEVNSLQIQMGLAWIVGVASFGLIIVGNITDCRIARQYLCQASLIICSLSVLSLTAVESMNGYGLFVWIYGLSYGAYIYSLKTYVFEKARAKRFARAWGFCQCAMGLSNLIGIAACRELLFTPYLSLLIVIYLQYI